MRNNNPINDRLRLLWDEFQQSGDGSALSQFLRSERVATRTCSHEYPALHRVIDVDIAGAPYRLSRCVICSERLALTPISLQQFDSQVGVPLWFSGASLQKWVEQHPLDEPGASCDREEFWRILDLSYRGRESELIEIASGHPDTAVRISAMRAMSRRAASPAIENALTSLVQDSDEDVRLSAIETVTVLGIATPIMRKEFLLAMTSHEESVRQWAMENLQRDQVDEKVGNVLQACLSDAGRLLRVTAAQTLWVLTDNKCGTETILDELNWIASEDWLFEMMREEFEELVILVRDAIDVDPRIRATLENPKDHSNSDLASIVQNACS